MSTIPLATHSTPPSEPLKAKDFASDQDVRWCPGCGDYAILNQVRKVMATLQAVREKTVPKRIDDRLVTIKDPRILAYTEEELRALQREVRDANFRIFTDEKVITVFNRDVFVRGTEIQEIFGQLGVDEPTHAFYLGKELERARIAIALGKTYRQEGALSWGYLTPPDDVRSEHVKLTARRKRARPERDEAAGRRGGTE